MQRSETEQALAPHLSPAVLGAWVLSLLGTTALFVFQSFYPDLIGPLSNVLPSAGAGFAFVSAFACWKRYGLGIRRPFERTWMYFSLGTGLWVAAEFTWALYYFVLNVEIPYPSAADFFYIGGYLPMFVGVALYLRQFWAGMSRNRLAFAIAAIVFSTAAVFAVSLPAEGSETVMILKLLNDLAYPLLDILLLSLAILAIAIFAGGSISKWWYLFAAGSILYAVADEYFLYLDSAGAYYNGSIDDLLFILGYLVFGLAFLVHRSEL